MNVIDEDIIKAEIIDGLSQVNEGLTLDAIENLFNEDKRRLSTTFKASSSISGETIETTINWR